MRHEGALDGGCQAGRIGSGTPMRILAFDCATAHLSIAVAIDGAVVARHDEAAARGHGELLLPLIQATLATAGLGFAALDRIGVTVGPGHFTGLRIGLAAARGFRVATGLPVIGVTTLETLAHQVPAAERAGRRVLVCVDSKRAEPYFQIFDDRLRPLAGAVAMLPAAFAVDLPHGAPLIVAGDHGVLPALRMHGHDAIGAAAIHPDAAVVAALAAGRNAGEALNPFYLHPALVTAAAGGAA